jgi:amidase
MKRAAFLILVLLVTGCPALCAKTFDLDSATIADIDAAFKAGTLTAERLVQLCLARIRSYDREGPSLHAVMVLNLKAIETARELDAERKAKGPRSALHGIPVVLKDNYNTADLPTTGGSVLLEGSIPSADAFVVQKLRDAGAIILAKMNMSEFASPPSQSSLGGQSLNPHDLKRSPAGSSGGTGVAIAAAYAPLGCRIGELEALDVIFVDARERREPLSVISAVVHQPVLWLLVRIHQALRRHFRRQRRSYHHASATCK